MDNYQIIEKIESFPNWRYQFDLKGNMTLKPGDYRIVRHYERKKYFIDPVVKLYGGSLAGKRVLDLACNSGFWSLAAIKHGCDYVCGIEGRQINIDQANFVFNIKEVDNSRYNFITGNILEVDLKELGDFDIVLCPGVFYHINRPVLLFERMLQVNPEIIVIDTNLSPAKGSYLQLIFEDIFTLGHAIDYELVYHPTKQAVRDLGKLFGLNTIMLKPDFDSYAGSNVYRGGRRKAFILSAKLDLSTFPAETEAIDPPDYRQTPLWKRVIKKTIRKLLKVLGD